jgi:hypothetical protein
LVSNCSSSPLRNVTRTSGLIHACLSVLNALLCVSVYIKGISFLVSSVSGIAIFEKFCMNCWLKLMKLIKACTSLTIVGVG